MADESENTEIRLFARHPFDFNLIVQLFSNGEEIGDSYIIKPDGKMDKWPP